MSQPKGTPAGRGSERWLIAAAVLIVASITFLTFRHTLGHEFVSWDDDVYVYENPALTKLSPERTWALLSSFYYFAYIPVTMLSHTLDALLWGMNPRGHHLTNVLLHVANAVWVLALGVLFLRFSKGRVAPESGDRSAIYGMGIAAVLFAVHPLRAESVSWVSDRKDLLCTFFALPAVMAYLVHSNRRDGARGHGWLVASFALFVLAVLSKSTAVGFPIVLLLLDWLGGRRGASVFREKIPFLVVSATVAAISLALSPHTKPSYSVSHLSGLNALLFPFYSLSFPLLKTLAPADLGPIYPRVGLEWMIGGLIAVITVTGAGALLAKDGKKGILVAWLTYLLLLAPNIAGLGSGMQPVADRYSYLATISLFVLLGGAISAVWGRSEPKRRIVVAASGIALAVFLVTRTVPQAAHWRSSIGLWEFVVTEFPARRDYTDAYINLGAAYAQTGRRAEASAVLDKAMAMDPTNPKVLYNLGVISYFEGNRRKALDCFRRATEVDPHPATAFFNRALVSEELGLHDEAFDSMVQAARLGSKDAQDALTSRGIRW